MFRFSYLYIKLPYNGLGYNGYSVITDFFLVPAEFLLISIIITLWTGMTNSPKPSQQTQHIQKAWDGPVAANKRI